MDVDHPMPDDGVSWHRHTSIHCSGLLSRYGGSNGDRHNADHDRTRFRNPPAFFKAGNQSCDPFLCEAVPSRPTLTPSGHQSRVRLQTGCGFSKGRSWSDATHSSHSQGPARGRCPRPRPEYQGRREAAAPFAQSLRRQPAARVGCLQRRCQSHQRAQSPSNPRNPRVCQKSAQALPPISNEITELSISSVCQISSDVKFISRPPLVNDPSAPSVSFSSILPGFHDDGPQPFPLSRSDPDEFETEQQSINPTDDSFLNAQGPRLVL